LGTVTVTKIGFGVSTGFEMIDVVEGAEVDIEVEVDVVLEVHSV
jgi:hypothetical protein